jgi:hypothetical protein
LTLQLVNNGSGASAGINSVYVEMAAAH